MGKARDGEILSKNYTIRALDLGVRKLERSEKNLRT